MAAPSRRGWAPQPCTRAARLVRPAQRGCCCAAAAGLTSGAPEPVVRPAASRLRRGWPARAPHASPQPRRQPWPGRRALLGSESAGWFFSRKFPQQPGAAVHELAHAIKQAMHVAADAPAKASADSQGEVRRCSPALPSRPRLRSQVRAALATSSRRVERLQRRAPRMLCCF